MGAGEPAAGAAEIGLNGTVRAFLLAHEETPCPRRGDQTSRSEPPRPGAEHPVRSTAPEHTARQQRDSDRSSLPWWTRPSPTSAARVRVCRGGREVTLEQASGERSVLVLRQVDEYVNVIGRRGTRDQRPTMARRGVRQSPFNFFALHARQGQWLANHSFGRSALAQGVRVHERLTRSIVIKINGETRVAVQAHSVGAEGDAPPGHC